MTPVELTELLGVLAAIGSSIGVPLWLNHRKEAAAAEVRAGTNDANLRDDQREFIEVLRQENGTLRAEVTGLRATVAELRDQVDDLRTELATERREREQSEARTAEREARRERPEQ
jgi:predicted RNase H-like nuclease (RuvC/YqgF family)